MGETSREYIGNGGLVNNDLVLAAREILKDYEERTLYKNLYLHSTNGASDKYIARVYVIVSSPDCGISVVRVSKLFGKLYLTRYVICIKSFALTENQTL